MIDSIVNWSWLEFAGVIPGPLYLVVSGGFWGLAGLAALYWLLFHRPWSRLVGLGSALLFALTYWADRLFFSNPEGRLANAAFAGGLTILGLAYVFLSLRPLPELREWLKRRSHGRD